MSNSTSACGAIPEKFIFYTCAEENNAESTERAKDIDDLRESLGNSPRDLKVLTSRKATLLHSIGTNPWRPK